MPRGPFIKISAMTFEPRIVLRSSAVIVLWLAVSIRDGTMMAARDRHASVDSAVVRVIVRGFADSLAPRLKVEPRAVRDDADGFDLARVMEGASDGAVRSAREALLRSMRIDLADFARARDCAGAMAPDPGGTLHAGCPSHTEVWLALSIPSRREPVTTLQRQVEPLLLSDSSSRTVRVLALTRTSRGSVLDVFDIVVHKAQHTWQVRERRHLLTID